ncbi:MAG: hypothetical protein WC621_00470 [Patescibacteria group bacterium]
MKLVANSEVTGKATVAIRWCLSKEEVATLREKKITDPYLLFVIVHDKVNVDRQLVRLNQIMTYLSFNHPGSNTVFATIVWHGSKTKLKEWCLYTDKDGDWRNKFYDSEADMLVAGDWGEVRIDVDVSPEFFAKEPPAWEKRWVNLWFERKMPRHQCKYRKRRMLAYSIQPPLVLAFIIFISLFRFLAAVFWILFRTKTEVNLKPIVRPFEYDSNDVWWQAKTARNFYAENKNYKERSRLVWLYHPVVIILASALLFISDRTFGGLFLASHFFSAWWLYILLSPIAITLVVFVAFIITVVIFNFVKLIGLVFGKTSKEEKQTKKEDKQKRKKEAEQAVIETKLELIESDLLPLTCGEEQLIPELKALPKEKRTIYLRFLDLRSKLCKPFAGA